MLARLNSLPAEGGPLHKLLLVNTDIINIRLPFKMNNIFLIIPAHQYRLPLRLLHRININKLIPNMQIPRRLGCKAIYALELFDLLE
jgi:hypothetical protein